MFSRLEPFFRTSFRQTEYADTRLGIREDEKREKAQRDNTPDEQAKSSDPWTDETVVSIEALRAFLISFLRNEVEEEQQETAQTISVQRDVTAQQSHSHMNGKAAKAYQSTAMRNAERTAPPVTKSTISSTNSVKIEEIRVMNQLITDLNALASRNVEHLVIPKEESFLKSLQSAVKNAKQA